MECKTIRYEVADRIARLTLDRPDRGNAWTGRMHLEYRWALTEAEADPDVRVVVVTGAGRAHLDDHAVQRRPHQLGFGRRTCA